KPYALMVDDALFNARLRHDKLVGCFCGHCTAKFIENRELSDNFKHDKDLGELKKISRKYTDGKNDISKEAMSYIREYHSFQESSVITFLTKWRQDITLKYPEMLFLTNNYNGSWQPIYAVFDGGIA